MAELRRCRADDLNQLPQKVQPRRCLELIDGNVRQLFDGFTPRNAAMKMRAPPDRSQVWIVQVHGCSSNALCPRRDHIPEVAVLLAGRQDATEEDSRLHHFLIWCVMKAAAVRGVPRAGRPVATRHVALP